MIGEIIVKVNELIEKQKVKSIKYQGMSEVLSLDKSRNNLEKMVSTSRTYASPK